MSLSDLRTRIDDYYDKANIEYKLPGGIKVRARPQFWYNKAFKNKRERRNAIRKVRRILGGKFEKKHPRAIRFAAYGRAKPNQIAAIIQGLIDAGELDALRSTYPNLLDEQLIRKLQRKFKLGIDCAGYVQLAFIFAFIGNDNDTRRVRRRLGLHVRRGYEKLGDLPRRHFKKIAITDAQTGDLFVMKPRPGSKDRAWHTVIVVDHIVAGTEHTFLVDASWGTDLYGERAGGVARRELVYDTSIQEWWDISPIDVPPNKRPCGYERVKKGDKVCENSIGPYAGHVVYGMYRAKQKN